MAFKDTRQGEEAPVLIKSDDRGEQYNHPAFGQIGASRVTGHSSLYDSDFDHNAFITITIRRSTLNRNLGRDWHFGHGELIEVALSEAQWATFVSSPNQGTGVPCTIQHIQGERMPGIPMADRVPQFEKEMKETLSDSLRHLNELQAEVEALGLSAKKTDKLLGTLRMARMQIESNAPFVESQFGDHMEKTVEKAKAEVHGYMTNVINRAGLAAISEGKLPLMIESD
jgi:hypothetical protein